MAVLGRRSFTSSSSSSSMETAALTKGVGCFFFGWWWLRNISGPGVCTGGGIGSSSSAY